MSNMMIDRSEGVVLLSDKQIANLLSMSQSWVRGERYKRRHGIDHNFTVDALMIGRSPRYRASEVFDWINKFRIKGD